MNQWKLDQDTSDPQVEDKQAHGGTSKYPQTNSPMGYLKPGTVPKEGRISYVTKPPNLLSLHTVPTHCPVADSLSSAVLPAAPLRIICFVLPQVNSCHFHPLDGSQIIAPQPIKRNTTKKVSIFVLVVIFVLISF